MNDNSIEQTSFSLANCSLFWVFSVSGRKKLEDVDEDGGGNGLSASTSGVELNIGGSGWWSVRLSSGKFEENSKLFIILHENAFFFF